MNLLTELVTIILMLLWWMHACVRVKEVHVFHKWKNIQTLIQEDPPPPLGFKLPALQRADTTTAFHTRWRCWPTRWLYERTLDARCHVPHHRASDPGLGRLSSSWRAGTLSWAASRGPDAVCLWAASAGLCSHTTPAPASSATDWTSHRDRLDPECARPTEKRTRVLTCITHFFHSNTCMHSPQQHQNYWAQWEDSSEMMDSKEIYAGLFKSLGFVSFSLRNLSFYSERMH